MAYLISQAQTCGNCHQEIYQEWKMSTHVYAYLDDLQFMAEMSKKDPNDPTSDVTWMCLNCHTPLINQQENLIVGLENGLNHATKVKNPYFDASLQKEAITCASCHVREGSIIGPYGNPDNLAPHPVTKSDKLTESEWCNQCHQAQVSFQRNQFGVFFFQQERSMPPRRIRINPVKIATYLHIDRPLVAGGPVFVKRGTTILVEVSFPNNINLQMTWKEMEKIYSSGLEIELQSMHLNQVPTLGIS